MTTKNGANQNLSVNLESQRARLLAWLKTSPITTLQARKELDIMHPAARIQELRERGNNIMTHWTTDNTSKGRHRVARYTLLARV